MSKRSYDGPIPCPGCGRPGTEVPREKKDGLCDHCRLALEAGKDVIRDNKSPFTIDDLVIGEMTWYSIPNTQIEKALVNLLQTFSKAEEKYASRIDWRESFLAGKPEATTGRYQIVLPKETMDAARELCTVLKTVAKEVKDKENNCWFECEERLKEEKNDIYNEGVERGRNLLFQLNNGEITLDDFSKRIKKF